MLTEERFNALYDAHAGRLVNWLVAGGIEYGTACDIVQETFLRLWRSRQEFCNREVPAAWLFATAGHLRTDVWRSTRRQNLCEDMAHVRDQDGREPATEDMHGDALLRKRLIRELAKLPEEQRTAYTLSRIGGNSLKEIAALTGASENLVKVRIYRAGKKLQHLLADLADPD